MQMEPIGQITGEICARVTTGLRVAVWMFVPTKRYADGHDTSIDC
jgi:hypothetical protein